MNNPEGRGVVRGEFVNHNTTFYLELLKILEFCEMSATRWPQVFHAVSFIT